MRTSWPPGQRCSTSARWADTGCGCSGVRIEERGEELVAVRVDLVALVFGEGAAQDAALVGEDPGVRRSRCLHEASRALDVAQEEADRSLCRLAHPAESTSARPRTG